MHESSTLNDMRKELEETLWAKLEPIFEPRDPEPDLELEQEAPTQHGDDREPESDAPDGLSDNAQPTGTCPVIALAPVGGMLMRAFDYQGEQPGSLRAYSMRPVPVAGLHASFLRVFTVERTLIPDVNYHSVHGGMTVGLTLGRMAFELSGVYKRPVKMGSIHSNVWFPRATAFGYEGHAAVIVRATTWLDVLLGGGLEHYHLQLHATPSTSPGVARSATDFFTHGRLGLVFYLPRRDGRS